MSIRLRFVAFALCLLSTRAFAQVPVTYRVTVPDPHHRLMSVEAVFPAVLPGPLRVQMSRSSPGRYAVHEFAKNVFDVRITDGEGRPVTVTRPNPRAWDVEGHDGTVIVRYQVFGDRLDGTYLAIDDTHLHINVPAALAWARGLEQRPIRVTIDVPAASGWRVATQLPPEAGDPRSFTAPDLQYLMDSPIEVSDHAVRTFVVPDDGRPATFRIAMHHQATDADLDAFAREAETIVREERAVIGELPRYDYGTYTFLIDYLPWAHGDGMEHRNSTVITSSGSIATPADRRQRLGTLAHEFFHGWNVERIRPKAIEPFDFADANMSGELWLAEGVTSYYEALVMRRTGLDPMPDTLEAFAQLVNAARLSPGTSWRSVEDMSRLAPFVDAASSIDRTNWENTFLSYYTAGAAVGLALDLALREHTGGRATLDDFMRAMWRIHGAPGGTPTGFVARPYTARDAQDRLAEVSDAGFARDFFERFIHGHEIPDYDHLLGLAGLVLRPKHPGRAWLGDLRLERRRVASPVVSNWPVYEAGLMEGDEVVSVGGIEVGTAEDVDRALSQHAPGDRVELRYLRRSGNAATATVTLRESPAVVLVPIERAGVALTDTALATLRAFRDAWLGSKVAAP